MSWHIEGCTGACLACLIEETVRQHYGTQGLEFLRRKVGADATATEYDLTKCPACGGPADNGHDRCVPPSPYFCTKCEGLRPKRHNDSAHQPGLFPACVPRRG